MRRNIWLSLALGLALVGTRTASATDYWDAAGETDTGPGTDNELYHGASQQHDLEVNGAVADEDWSMVINYPQSSYEAVVDATSGDIDMQNLGNFTRLNSSGVTVLQTSEYANVGAPGAGYSVALRWQNLGGTIERQNLRVLGTCGVACGADDQYRIRFYDTTLAVPRFNNAAGQVTVLIIQNPMRWTRPIAGTIYFWNAAGTLLGNFPFSLAQKAALVLNTTSVAGVGGQSGTITIAHDGGYGSLAVKAVALDPATGFSFDTPGSYRPL